ILVPLKIGRVGKDGEASRAAMLVGEGVFGRAEVVTNEPLGGRCLLDLRNQPKPGCSLRLKRRAETAWRGCGCCGAVQIAYGRLRLACGHFFALGGADLGQLVSHCPCAIQQSSRALASPLSMTSVASSTPSAQ